MKSHVWLSLIAITVVVCTAHEIHSDETTGFSRADTLPADTAEQPIDILRKEYLELAKLKSELMDTDALQEDITATKQKIDQLRALKQLAEAESILKRVANEFPNSAAARTATQMLAVPRNGTPEEDFSRPRRDSTDWNRSPTFDRDAPTGFPSEDLNSDDTNGDFQRS